MKSTLALPGPAPARTHFPEALLAISSASSSRSCSACRRARSDAANSCQGGKGSGQPQECHSFCTHCSLPTASGRYWDIPGGLMDKPAAGYPLAALALQWSYFSLSLKCSPHKARGEKSMKISNTQALSSRRNHCATCSDRQSRCKVGAELSKCFRFSQSSQHEDKKRIKIKKLQHNSTRSTEP